MLLQLYQQCALCLLDIFVTQIHKKTPFYLNIFQVFVECNSAKVVLGTTATSYLSAHSGGMLS